MIYTHGTIEQKEGSASQGSNFRVVLSERILDYEHVPKLEDSTSQIAQNVRSGAGGGRTFETTKKREI